MNLEDMMAHLSDAGDDATENLTDVQMIGRLKSIHELRGEKHDFKPGQIIRHKYPDLSATKTASSPKIFVRYLTKPHIVADHPEAFSDVKNWGSNIATHVFDCVTASIWQGSYSEHFTVSADHRPATEADYGPVIGI